MYKCLYILLELLLTCPMEWHEKFLYETINNILNLKCNASLYTLL